MTRLRRAIRYLGEEAAAEGRDETPSMMQKSQGSTVALSLELSEELEAAIAGDYAKRVRAKVSNTGGAVDKREICNCSASSDNLLRYHGQIFVPAGMRSELMLLCHEDPSAGPQGVSRTLARVA